MTANGHKIFRGGGDDDNVLQLVVMVAQLCEY